MTARPPHTGKYLLLVLLVSLMAFGVSALTTTRILRRISVVEVPDIVGKSVETARSALRMQRLSLDIIEFRFDARLPANQILAQDPAAGNEVKSGRIVRVVVSRGSQSLKTPDIVGQDARDGNVALSQKGLHPGRITRMYSDEAPKNSVLAQWPSAGDVSYPGRSVNLLVSAGPRPHQWLMPALTGLAFADAERVLKFLELELDTITPEPDETHPSNTVLSQTPLPGDWVGAGSSTALVVSRRSGDPTVVPPRFLTVTYRMPEGTAQVRLRLVVVDSRGRREIFNAMERPGADVRLNTTVHGAQAGLQIYLNGTLSEERKL